MAGLSVEAAGLANYIIKRDWRRYQDRELRAEGHEGLMLNANVASNIQITPLGSSTPVKLVAEARRGDGKKVIIAGNQTTLWAYTGTDDTHYVLNNSGVPDYFANDTGIYVDETQYGWIQIASGLSANGRRWEAVQVGDFLVLNNGVDLPMTYHPGDTQAYPIYELREQQISSVGTVAAHNGNLLVMDLWTINDTDFQNLMAPTTSAVSASVNSSGVVSVVAGTLFPGVAVTPGLTMFWADGSAATVLSVSAGVIQTDIAQAIFSGTVYLENPLAYAAFMDTTKMQRYPWRVLPSLPGLPRRFGATVPVSANLDDRALTFQYPVRSLPELVYYNNATGTTVGGNIGGATDIQVLYAGLAGATLNTSIIGIRNGIAMNCFIADAVQYPITGDPTAEQISSFEASDAADSYAGTFIDLIGDGGAILKAMQLRDQIVIYKETAALFLGAFTGDSTTPYNFTQVTLANEGQALKYRNCIIPTGGGFYASAHIYAGRNAFYKFDLFMQTPQEIPDLSAAQELFFQNAVNDPENAFAAENPLTREWFFGWDTPGTDRALCYDYATKTCRTTSATISSAAAVQHPTRGDWIFIFGSDDGSVQRYGLWDAPVEQPSNVTVAINGTVATASANYFTPNHIGKTIVLANGVTAAITACTSATQVKVSNTAAQTAQSFMILPAIWHRNGQGYQSLLESGLGDLGMADNEKLVSRYVPISGSMLCWEKVILPILPTLLNISFKTATNPTTQPTWAFSNLAVQQPHNLVQPTFIGYLVGDQVSISGANMPFALVNRIWDAKPMGSKSAGRL